MVSGLSPNTLITSLEQSPASTVEHGGGGRPGLDGGAGLRLDKELDVGHGGGVGDHGGSLGE